MTATTQAAGRRGAQPVRLQRLPLPSFERGNSCVQWLPSVSWETGASGWTTTPMVFHASGAYSGTGRVGLVLPVHPSVGTGNQSKELVDQELLRSVADRVVCEPVLTGRAAGKALITLTSPR